MRGKKIDAEFVSDFIIQCAKKGITNPQEVCGAAEKQIATIDEKIIEVEKLKKKRSKLSDVLITLSDKIKDKTEEKKLLTFYQLSDILGAYTLATKLNFYSLDIKMIDKSQSLLVKEMLSSKILRRDGDKLAQGDEFHNFADFCYENGYHSSAPQEQ